MSTTESTRLKVRHIGRELLQAVPTTPVDLEIEVTIPTEEQVVNFGMFGPLLVYLPCVVLTEYCLHHADGSKY